MRLIATWTKQQNPETDNPVAVRWSDGSPATMEDFSRILGDTQSYPDVTEDAVEFSYEVQSFEALR